MSRGDRRSGKKLATIVVGVMSLVACAYLVGSGLWSDAQRAITALSQPRESGTPPPGLDTAPAAVSRGTGTVELKVNRTAKVYVDDRLMGEARGGDRFSLQVDAGTKHTFRFHDDTRGTDKTLELEVRAGDTIRADVLMQ